MASNVQCVDVRVTPNNRRALRETEEVGGLLDELVCWITWIAERWCLKRGSPYWRNSTICPEYEINWVQRDTRASSTCKVGIPKVWRPHKKTSQYV